MPDLRIALIVLLVFLVPAAFAEARPAFAVPYATYKLAAPIPPEKLTRVLVLGTPHLVTMRESLTRAHLGPVIERLESFQPALIAVEKLPGETIQAMLARNQIFEPVIKHFAAWISRHGVETQQRLKLDADGARARLHALLETFGEDVKPDQRRRAVALAIAAFDTPTAALQWRHLDGDERKAVDGVSQAAAERLDGLLETWSETYSLGVETAYRLGHQRIASIDDHLDKDELLPITAALEKLLIESGTMEKAKKAPGAVQMQERQKQALHAGNLWPLYEWLNSADYVQADIAKQFHLFFELDDAAGLARKRSALWEVRNLNIASNIRRVSADVGNGSVLVIIGAGHKAFLEAYLSQMMDMRVVRLGELPR